MNSNTVIYTPNHRVKSGFFATWGIMAGNIYRSRELIFQLFKRDFFNAYRKSFLGISWVVVSPIIGIASWVFMNATGILQPGNVGIPFPAFVLISSSIWGLFMGFYSAGASTLGAGGSFIMQVKYPHEALLLKQVAQHLANFTITFSSNSSIILWNSS
jgi:lipopolysaccharide transport system permease protein